MATRTKDTAPLGKEKRGTSPTQQGKSTTSTSSKTTSPVRQQSNATTLNKNIPSYLKPTISSIRENARAQKSASLSDLHNNNHNNKPTLTRRLSLDKPPLPSSSPKTRVSPNPKERIPRSSSSLSAKTSTSQKPHLDKLSKAPRTSSKDVVGKQHGTSLQYRPVNRKKTTTTTTATTRKHDSPSSSTTKASTMPNSQGEHSEPEDHQESIIHKTEKEMIVSDNEMAASSDAGDNDSAFDDDDEELTGNFNTSAELEDNRTAADSSSIVVENQLIETEEKQEAEEPKEIINIELNEPDDSSEKEKEETVVDESKENQESKEEDEGINKGEEVPMTQQQQQLHLNPVQVVVGSEETHETVLEENAAVASPSKPQHQVVQGKKEPNVVSNNVIEETASKLREQRKNKVKALAGAFETVISLQDPK